MTALLFAVLLPNANLTPGVVLSVSAAQVCRAGYARSVRRPYDAAWRRLAYRVRREYGVRGRGYRIDHLVPLEIGGSNDIANLWPQPIEESFRKDAVENALHVSVCAGRLSISEAQREIARDWGNTVVGLPAER